MVESLRARHFGPVIPAPISMLNQKLSLRGANLHCSWPLVTLSVNRHFRYSTVREYITNCRRLFRRDSNCQPIDRSDG